jgi:cation:H+ antiporter
MTGETWPLPIAVIAFALAAVVTVYGSVRLAGLGDVLADRLGVGEALFGAVLFGAVTSLSGIIMTATAAVDGHPGLAYGNAVGGIAAQTAALAVVDLCYRHANLEHAAASLPNIMFGLLLAAMLAISLLLGYMPEWLVFGMHPGGLLVIGAYLYGVKLVREVRRAPGWHAQPSPETRADVPGPRAGQRSTARLLLVFLVLGAVVSVSGWAIAHAAAAIVAHTELTDTFVAVLLMGAINAAPETITAIAAVRRGALTLAVAAVLGGNAFDALNLVIGDIAYRDGSLFHAARPDQLFVTALSLLLTVIVLMGLLHRQTYGAARIGWESVALLAVYASGMARIAIGG